MGEKEKDELVYEWRGKSDEGKGGVVMREGFEGEVKKRGDGVGVELEGDEWR
ncbi:hypothetical protein [Bacillus altitudinis]|uniref:hypothetical protein n=1 Tax=Bacillus altitudinis TaxID=293387 RepID=UPI001643A661|nr:hypothetical protein [Bacillus altitudinis]